MYLTASKKILLLSTILISSGCTSIGGFFKPDIPPPVVEIRTVEVKIPIVHPVMPRAIDLKDPEFYVVSDKNIDEFLAEMEKLNKVLVFVAMTIDDYELMSYNMQEIRRYVNQMKEVVFYYRTINEEPKVDDETESEK